MSNRVRVRFAPSPTGPLHIGGVRTALYNYLFAKKSGGDFILRIEDTDQKRSVPESENYIINALEWLGIEPDESPTKRGSSGPYRQSERRETYANLIQVLLKNGSAYYSFDSAELLENQRRDHEKKGKTFTYNWHNRLKLESSLRLGEEETNKKILKGEPYVVRFKMWTEGEDKMFTSNDIIRNDVQVDLSLLDDKVLFKSDGMPTYHFANVVDDHHMNISHVIRGEEWLPSLALHLKLYRAFGWESPRFAHLPLILKPSGKGKLSKRDGDKMGFPVFPIRWDKDNVNGYKEKGFMPEAVLNFLAFLGWNPGTEKEVFSLEELISGFDLRNVNLAGARFDPEKNKWFNQQHIQRMDEKDFIAQCHIAFEEKEIQLSPNKAQAIAQIIKPRIVLLTDIWEEGKLFFESPAFFDEGSVKKVWKQGTGDLLEKVILKIKEGANLKPDSFKNTLKKIAKDSDVGLGALMGPLRLCLVGSLTGPDLLKLVHLLGEKTVVKRIRFRLDSSE
jgi:glutamyl-tRNA synthetase